MINNIAVKNFKSLKDVSVPLGRLNILGGLNGMGKSSLLHVLLLLKQSNLKTNDRLSLKGNLVGLGKGLDVLYQFANDEKISFEFSFDENSQKAVFEFDWNADDTALKLTKKEGNCSSAFLSCLENLQYISADRIGPSDMYEMDLGLVKEGNLGSRGQFAAHYIAENGNRMKIGKERMHKNEMSGFLINQVNTWLSEISPGVRITPTEVAGADKILVSYEFELKNGKTQPFKPVNVGYGISYALSIIVALLIAEKDQVVIIENPEAHIHPHGQAELGKLVSLAASSGAQIIVETHSDHIINGVRVAVKEGLIANNTVFFPWFEKVTTENEQFTKITAIKIDKNGELSRYPKDFLEEWNNQLLKLV
jgi:predicted ATPase